MRYVVRWVVCVASVFSGTSVGAETFVQTHSFDLQHHYSTTSLTTGDHASGSQTLSFLGFDPTLGTLESATWELVSNALGAMVTASFVGPSNSIVTGQHDGSNAGYSFDLKGARDPFGTFFLNPEDCLGHGSCGTGAVLNTFPVGQFPVSALSFSDFLSNPVDVSVTAFVNGGFYSGPLFLAQGNVRFVGALRLTYEFAPLAAIPEPETYAMLLAGLALLGFATRRRRGLHAAA